MDEHLVSLLTKHCTASATQSAQAICDNARERGLDYSAIVAPFRQILSEHELAPVNDWQDAQRVITRACFILESRQVLLNIQASQTETLEA